MRKILSASLLLVPAVASALTYADRTDRYADAPFSSEDAAGISVLTDIGLVEGNPDGTFRPRRGVNRAEMAKLMVGLLHHYNPPAADFSLDDFDRDCFPDVRAGDWFAPYVCFLESSRVIGGYPDGTFKPDRPVNYAEALKFLHVGLTVPAAEPGEQWYAPYARTVRLKKTGLLPPPAYDAFLTRGEVARLIAADVAFEKGELPRYRAAEDGEWESESSASSSEESSVSSESSSSVSSESGTGSSASSVSTSSASSLVRGRLLMLGGLSPLLAADTVVSEGEDARIRYAEVDFDVEMESVSGVFLVNQAGEKIGTLTLDEHEDDDDRWIGGFVGDAGYRIAADVPTVIGVAVELKSPGSGGGSEQLVWVRSFVLGLEGVQSAQTRRIPLGGPEAVFPKHQTVQGEITHVVSLPIPSTALTAGSARTIAAFAFSGVTLTSDPLKVEELVFTIDRRGVSADGWVLEDELGQPSGCGMDQATAVLSCSVRQESRTLPRTLTLKANLVLEAGVQDPHLQVSLADAGSVGAPGSVRWSDGVGRLSWLELPSPLAVGPRLE